MIDTKKLRRDIDIALKDAGYGIGVNVSLITMRDLIDVIDELDRAREELAAYAPVREFYGPAGLKAVSEIIAERDAAMDLVIRLTENEVMPKPGQTVCAHGNPEPMLCKECR